MRCAMNNAVLEAVNLVKVFPGSRKGLVSRGSDLTAVDEVSFSLYKGELLGLLGESGCGKSTVAKMLMHLISPTSGTILMDGEEVQNLSESAFRRRRRQIQMVYQNPFDCLDPRMRVRSLLEEPLKIWFPEMGEQIRQDRIHNMLKECGLPGNCLDKKPGEFSGGQLQRISIARALLVEPEILIADEIISALDVSVQNQILNLLIQMKQRHHLSILFITHDLSVARMVSDRVMVMQSGRIKGIGSPEEVFSNSADPYIRELTEAVFTLS